MTENNPEQKRLKTRSLGRLLSKTPPIPPQSSSQITSTNPSLLHLHGSDIIKRNAPRATRYLLLFPGALQLPDDTSLGNLSDLHTRNPVFTFTGLEKGTLILKGTLVHPRNTFITVKPPRVSKKSISKSARNPSPVKILDVLDTLIVFSEWNWIQNENHGVDTCSESEKKSLFPESNETFENTKKIEEEFEEESDEEIRYPKVSSSVNMKQGTLKRFVKRRRVETDSIDDEEPVVELESEKEQEISVEQRPKRQRKPVPAAVIDVDESSDSQKSVHDNSDDEILIESSAEDDEHESDSDFQI